MMKIVTGIFEPEDVSETVRHLTENGFDREDLSMISAAAEVPDDLEGESEHAAASGAAVGAVAGASVGAMGAWVVSTIPGFETMFTAGLIATAAGSAIGGYLGSLYGVRSEGLPHIDIYGALEAGKTIVVVRMKGAVDDVQAAVDILEQSKGEHVEVHTISTEESG